jgi:hypothetical protein
MNYTKKRKIKEANMLLEKRFLMTEVVNKNDKAKPNENQWYTAEDPKSVKTPKGWKIYVKRFGKDPIDPVSDQEFIEFKDYFIEYPTQQDADTKFNEFYNKLITKQTKPDQSGSTTTTTTLKPGTTPQTPKEFGASQISQDELIDMMATNLKAQGIGK